MIKVNDKAQITCAEVKLITAWKCKVCGEVLLHERQRWSPKPEKLMHSFHNQNSCPGELKPTSIPPEIFEALAEQGVEELEKKDGSNK